MTPSISFAAAFVLTLVLLGITAWSGLRARRKIHVPAVGLTLVSLGLTIYCAYRLGDTLDLPSAGPITPIHLTLARLATLALLLPIAFGIRTLFVPRTRRLHGRLAWFALGIVVLAAATGVVMVSLAEPVGSP